MKKTLLVALLLCTSVWAQTPTISGDLLLCPNGTGTASIDNDVAYDSYQWYWKYWFSNDPFQPIAGADGPSFTYEWLTYDQALLKVEVTLSGQTYESNTLQIDSYVWLPITTGFEMNENVSINPENGNVLLCQGTTFPLQVFMPYSIVQWYRDGQPIPGAIEMTYTVSGPGVYHVVAAPEFCPNNGSSSEGTPTVVEINPDCGLQTQEPEASRFTAYPNPGRNVVHVALDPLEEVVVYNLTGQRVLEARNTTTINVENLSPGVYLLNAGHWTRLVVE